MAGDWIKLEHTTPDKPEVFAMADTLGIDPDAVTGKLCRVWIWADQQTYDGNARGVTKLLLDRVAGVTGFADAMISAGWLSQTDGGLQFSNHAAHNGQTAKQRANTARRVSLHRSKCNDGSVTKALPEKRREKKKEVIYSEVFELFWSECPRKTGKGVAAKAFSSAVGRGHSAESITEAMSKFAIAQ